MAILKMHRHLLIFATTIVILPSRISSTPQPTPVSGIFETLIDSYTYQSYTTLLFNFSLSSSFDQDSLVIQPYVSKFQGAFGICNKTEFGNQCPQMVYLNKILEHTFPSYFQALFGDINNESIQFKAADCDVIKPHFGRGARRNQAAIQEYVKKLEACEFSVTTIQKPGLPSETQDFYTNMSTNTGKVYSGLISNTNQGFVASQNTHLATYALFLLNQHMENMKWKEAVRQCQNGYIPRSLIPAQALRNELDADEANLEAKKYNLTIPLNSIETYFNLLLADCTLVEKTHLLVRVQIPIRSMESSPKLVKLQGIPFMRKSEICFMSHVQNMIYLVQASNLFTESNCGPNQLCKIPKDGTRWDFEHDPCTSAYLTNSEKEMKEHCKILDCLPYKSSTPVFQQISTDRLVMTMGSGLGTTPVFVHCNGKPTEVVKPVSEGALDLTIPCGCDIVYNSKEVFRASEPCGSNFNARPIIPYEWEEKSGDETEEGTDHDDHDKHLLPEKCCNEDNSALHTMAAIILVLILASIVLLIVFICKVKRLENIRYKTDSTISFSNNIYDEPRLL